MKWYKKIFIWFFAILTILVTWFYQMVIYDAPTFPKSTIEESDLVQISQTHFVLNNSWLRQNESGNWDCYIEGNGYDRGRTLGILQKELGKQQEAIFVAEIDKHVPSWWFKKMLLIGISWFNKDLDQQIPAEYRQEIYGISEFFSDDFDDIGPKYNRIVNYHAAHDIGHAVQNMHLVGCTALGVWKFDSVEQRMLMGRNFDFYFGDDFAKNKVVLLSNPDTGFKFISVTWPSFIGVVSGLNEKGLGITLNSDKSEIPTTSGTPVSIIARDILQYASNIEEAVALSNKYKSFVSESFTISSAIDQMAVVIEKTPDATGVYITQVDTIVVTNHFQSEELKGLQINTEHMMTSESVRRCDRTEELVSQMDTLSPETIALILRDQKGLNQTNIGMGNPLALNQLLAHHAVIFENVQKTIWVSAYPFQLNIMPAYSLKDFDSWSADKVHFPITIDSLKIDADPFFESAEYDRFNTYKNLRDMIVQATGTKKVLADDLISEFIDSNPELYETHRLLGNYYFVLGEKENAVKAYEKALSKQVPYQEDVDFIEARLIEIQAHD